MKKIIIMAFVATLMALVACEKIHAKGKAVYDSFENNIKTANELKDEIEEAIDRFVKIDGKRSVMCDFVLEAYKAGKVDDNFAKKFIEANDAVNLAADAFWDYVKVYDAVQAGKMKPNAYNRKSFIWKYNDWRGKYIKVLDMVKTVADMED